MNILEKFGKNLWGIDAPFAIPLLGGYTPNPFAATDCSMLPCERIFAIYFNYTYNLRTVFDSLAECMTKWQSRYFPLFFLFLFLSLSFLRSFSFLPSYSLSFSLFHDHFNNHRFNVS